MSQEQLYKYYQPKKSLTIRLNSLQDRRMSPTFWNRSPINPILVSKSNSWVILSDKLCLLKLQVIYMAVKINNTLYVSTFLK